MSVVLLNYNCSGGHCGILPCLAVAYYNETHVVFWGGCRVGEIFTTFVGVICNTVNPRSAGIYVDGLKLP